MTKRKKKRYVVFKDFYAGLSPDKGWAVYDRERNNLDDPPLAVFKRKSHAQDYARRLNRTRSK